MRLWPFLAAGGEVACAMLAMSSCGTDSSGTIVPRDAGREAAPFDSGVDRGAPPVDAETDAPVDAKEGGQGCDFASCTGACCGGSCQPAAHDCAACGTTVFCALAISPEIGNCVPTCSGCSTGTVACHGTCQVSPDCD